MLEDKNFWGIFVLENTDNVEQNFEQKLSNTFADHKLVKAHAGMRGLLAFYIMLFHALLYYVGWNLHGSALMPIFFLLAGYSSAIVYGNRLHRLDVKHYYRNRFARIAPIYYVAMLIAIPLAVTGHGWVPPSDIGWVLATNAFAVQMWAGFRPLSFSGPAWTISTLIFFYLIFPWLLRWHQSQTNWFLNRWITILAVIQGVVFFVLWFAIGSVNFLWASWASHAWPISRLPVFDMGRVAGLLLLRQGHPDGPSAVKVMGVSTDQKNRWARRVEWCAGSCAVLRIILSVLQINGIDLGGDFWMQGIFPYMLLVIIVGLSITSQNTASYTQRLLSWPVFLFFGRISLSLYLVHEPVIQYIAWIARPNQAWSSKMSMPLWWVAIVLPVSLILATLLERMIETPARNFIRGR